MLSSTGTLIRINEPADQSHAKDNHGNSRVEDEEKNVSDNEIEVIRGEVEIRKLIVWWPQQLFINKRICSIWRHVSPGFNDSQSSSLHLFCTQK